MRKFVVFALLTTISITAQAQSVLRDGGVFRGFVDTTAQVLGGSVDLHIYATPGATLTWNDSISSAVEVGSRMDTSKPGIHLIRTFLLLDTGEITLPVCEANFEGETYGMEIQRVKVELLDSDESEAPAPDRPLEEVPFKLWWWFLHYWINFAAAGAGLLLALLLRRYLKHRKSPESIAPVATPRDYYKEAIEGLRALKEGRPWEQDEKEFYVALGDLVRIYLAHRTGLPLSEQTTSESMEMLHNRWTGNQLDAYSYIMMRADIVKFARGKMDVSEHLDCLERAGRLIAEFKPTEDVA